MAKEDNKKDDVKKDDRLKALDAALSQIEKQYGKGSVMKLGDTSHMQVETVPTGSLSLDIALGAGWCDRKSRRTKDHLSVYPCSGSEWTYRSCICKIPQETDQGTADRSPGELQRIPAGSRTSKRTKAVHPLYGRR